MINNEYENQCKEIITGDNIQIRMPILVKLDKLKPNPWNPNKVARPEMELLKISIRKKSLEWNMYQSLY